MKETNKRFYDFLLENKEAKQDARFFFDEKRSYSSNDVFYMAMNLANQLHKSNVKEGDLVALRATRSLDTAIIIYALQILGTQTILCDPHQKVSDLLKECKSEIIPKYIITNIDSSSDIAANGNFKLKNTDYSDIVMLDVNNTNVATPDFNLYVATYTPAIIIFTSGSTGKNKAVMLSQHNYLNHIQNYYNEGNYEPNDINIEALPIFHVFGLAVIIMGLIRKYQIFFPKTTDVAYVAEMILRHKITRLDGVPSYALAIANYYKANNITKNSLRVGVLGGAPSSYEQFVYIEDTLDIKLLPVYGMSECIAITGAGITHSRENRAHSVGTLLPLCDCKIIDDDGNVLQANQIGEVTASGPMVMLGYYQDKEETNNAIKNNRLYTGDLGFIDENNYLHIVGRKKDIIIRHGNNISSVKIEQKIELIEEIASCAVVGIKHEKYGEVPAALIVLKENVTLSMDALKEKIEKSLAKIEIPEIIKVVDHIPQTNTGKIDKVKVKETILNG